MHVEILATEIKCCSRFRARNVPTIDRSSDPTHLRYCSHRFLAIWLNQCLRALLGVTLAGAGGGGFLAALAKTPSDARTCQDLIQEENIPNVSLFAACIDRHGPLITFS